MVGIATIFVVVVLIVSFAIMWRAETADGIEYIAVGAFAFLTLTYRQYYVKAEQENQIKLKRKYGEDYVSPQETISNNDD